MQDPNEPKEGEQEKKKTITTQNLRRISETELRIPNGRNKFHPGENCLMYLNEIAGDLTI